MAAPSLRLFWWDAPGRGGEPARLALTIAGIPFEDKRMAFGDDAWAAMKPGTPWGKMPILEIDGKMLAESGTILRWVARAAKLMPEDPWLALKVEEFLEVIQTDVELAAMFNGRKGEELVACRREAAAPGSLLHEWLA
eukprot:CAMPEP_0115334370 /NCGR_PEP_ID=MMETSP0270-20121206/87870_1 /TAXON_ID=71861 /ORGANISM="Scrippsiella trochoidea, Strain CCMP3099" /LENGTH=137 /DNA_ID=CAMNT_0002755339 /DNA_START=1 /DNA_END=411 /DNA_ORIENTATION=-